MEAIDDYANENIVRSIAYTALDKIQNHQYHELLPFSSQPLRQRAQFLPNEDWYQWQKDNCAQMIESVWTEKGNIADELYQKQVYYKRMDADTLHAIVEFAERDKSHFVVILILENGSGDMSDAKYHNIKELSDAEWLDIFENWSRTLEEAERIFLTKVTRHKREFTMDTPDSSKGGKEAPEDYWGDWSSDEASSTEDTGSNFNPQKADQEETEDSEDEYYTRWSKDPGTLTPGPDEQKKSRILSTINQQEIDEEYDQSYNPLFTVPSVPNLMDAHTAALSELTQILQTSIPQPRGSTSTRPTVINPLPKAAMTRLAPQMESLQVTERFPGAYPESGMQTPGDRIEQTQYYKEAGRQLFMKSLSALIHAAKLLGYEGKDILEMVQEIVNKE
ncbi:hypothetical protein CU097_008225 [Rhizopus azygosporus]|uniref:Uncharacterized protein n=1 Tax=Rhizopus azygosporus TaxID=86630 RepID=A0A367JBV6_RHIAZ|nr:hypothetical protein CU097_008225 [Rhizopus azygosporus]